MSNFSTKRNLQPSFLTEYPKRLGIRSREICHKPKIFDSHGRSFMGKLCACWCCHMEPRGRSRSSWNLHALVWKTTRTLGYLNRMINSTAVRGRLQLYNTGREPGFPGIQPGIGHSDCCVYLLNALWSGHHGNYWDRKPGNLRQHLCCPHSTAKGHSESTFWILWIYLLQTSSLVFTFIMKCWTSLFSLYALWCVSTRVAWWASSLHPALLRYH